MRKDIIGVVVLNICLIVIISQYIIQYYELEELKDTFELQEAQIKSFKIRDIARFRRDMNKSRVNGLYYGDLMVIWLEDRTYMEALETFNHEWLHHKLREDFEPHFCKRYLNTYGDK